MEKKKLIYDIREAIRAYNIDAKVTNAFILELINTIRAKYINQDASKHLDIDTSQLTQTLLMYTEVVDRSYLSTVPVGLTVLRTIKSIPTLVSEDLLKSLSVRPIDMTSYEIEFMDKARALYANNPLFIYSYLEDDGKVYFVNKANNLHKMIKQVAISTILFQPDDITDINEYTTELVEYPLTGKIWALMKPEVVSLLVTSMNIPIDVIQDNQTMQ